VAFYPHLGYFITDMGYRVFHYRLKDQERKIHRLLSQSLLSDHHYSPPILDTSVCLDPKLLLNLGKMLSFTYCPVLKRPTYKIKSQRKNLEITLFVSYFPRMTDHCLASNVLNNNISHTLPCFIFFMKEDKSLLYYSILTDGFISWYHFWY
jgi:hypothetical protein